MKILVRSEDLEPGMKVDDEGDILTVVDVVHPDHSPIDIKITFESESGVIRYQAWFSLGELVQVFRKVRPI